MIMQFYLFKQSLYEFKELNGEVIEAWLMCEMDTV